MIYFITYKIRMNVHLLVYNVIKYGVFTVNREHPPRLLIYISLLTLPDTFISNKKVINLATRKKRLIRNV